MNRSAPAAAAENRGANGRAASFVRPIERQTTLVVAATTLSPRLLKGRTGTAHAASAPALPGTGTLQERLDAIEAMLLREVMLRQRWNKTRAAEVLGLSRVGLRAKLLRFGLESK